MADFLVGGWLRGYRTYVIAAVSIITLAANYAVGDADFVATATGIATAIGLLTAAKHEA